MLAKGGDASYAIYLTNLIAMDLVVRCWRVAGAPADAALVAPVGVATALAAGLVTYHLVERPILRDLKRVTWPPWRSPASAEVRTVGGAAL